MKALVIGLSTTAFLAGSSEVARADGWGAVKGQVAFARPVPAKKEIKRDKHPATIERPLNHPLPFLPERCRWT
jgi:hypothetical protein